jgi:hypothetical protein
MYDVPKSSSLNHRSSDVQIPSGDVSSSQAAPEAVTGSDASLVANADVMAQLLLRCPRPPEVPK